VRLSPGRKLGGTANKKPNIILILSNDLAMAEESWK